MDLYEAKNLNPMLLSEKEEPFDDKDYLFEIKFDGIRAIIYVSPNEIIIQNRHGKILNDIFPELFSIKQLVKKKCIFDGEIILMHEGKISFEKLAQRLQIKDKIKINYKAINNPVSFVCFDILYENKNLINISLEERKEILSKYPNTNNFVKSKAIIKNGKKLYNFVKKEGIEGIVAKKKDSKYIVGKRSKEWIKIKNLKDEYFYIGAYKEEKYMVSLAIGIKENKNLIFISKVTLKKNSNDFKIIKSIAESKNKFINFDNNQYTFLKPTLKCKITFLEKTNKNHLRHPVFKGLI